MSTEEEATLNIGALSMATGVPVETIRTWERRYGFPRSRRNEAGHRIYDLETIEHLRLITSVLAVGYRPSQLQGRSREELEALLEHSGSDEQDSDEAASAEKGSRSNGESMRSAESEGWLERWLDAVGQLDRERLEGQMRLDWSRMNALGFVEERVGPFLVALGEGWASGRLSVLHEHFASECVRDFLAAAWRPLSDMARGNKVILATLSGEQHCLGLHMAALIAAVANQRVVFIGANSPVEDIAAAAQQSGADGIALSMSQYANPAASRAFLETLRELTDPKLDIVVGGSGAPDDVEGVQRLGGFEDYYEFFQTWQRR
ncbi:MerR family transcriptional regulator [Lujinxingia vulgaris]|uniref:MerR family transcriptional regulator n=1 Tax=Lujinxingia vulgaris TaxID=2600176 RepID=A0A5C6WWT1_9DELT|nr:MerR family transcriptional regulator [Lujinxingia vulgaris]TXD33857.1 MerR family transcriptional regulator [Lujinxingia vulgaris]